MKLTFFKNLLFSILVISLSACNVNKNTTNDSEDECTTLGTVKDFTGLDGCGMMILLENGDKLLPAKINNEKFTLQDGQRIKFNYKVIEDAMSICMAEKASIEVTCIELATSGTTPFIPECYDAEDPKTVPWMKDLMRDLKPVSIEKFTFRDDGWAYLFYTATEQTLYDCQGNFICKHQGLGVNQCKVKYFKNQRGKFIFRNSTNPQK